MAGKVRSTRLTATALPAESRTSAVPGLASGAVNQGQLDTFQERSGWLQAFPIDRQVVRHGPGREPFNIGCRARPELRDDRLEIAKGVHP